MFRLTTHRRFLFAYARSLHHSTLPPTSKRRLFAGTSLSLTFAVTALVMAPNRSEDDDNRKPLGSLLRTYVVYSLCSIPPLVQHAPQLLSVLTSIPVVKHVTEAVVRVTFFDQFVGGDAAEDTIPLLERLRKHHNGVLFGYSVEVDEKAASSQGEHRSHGPPTHKKNVAEMIHSIDVAGNFEDRHNLPHQSVEHRKTWVAIKLSALLPTSQALANFSKHLLATRPTDPLVHYPGTPHARDLDVLRLTQPPRDSPLTQENLDDLKELYDDLVKICTRASERDVKLIIDAEHTWYQPAIDAMQLALMREFNKPRTVEQNGRQRQSVQPLVYGTFQAYLRRNTMHILRTVEAAQREGFTVGIKLVRGAYHNQEVKHNSPNEPDVRAIERYLLRVPVAGLPSFTRDGPAPPVWSDKSETDACYNGTASILLDYLKQPQPIVGLLFGTHNGESCDHIINELVQKGLGSRDASGKKAVVRDNVAGRIAFGQLYGMRDILTDHLTETLVTSSPVVLKYVPYGALSDVIPYLGRRAIENQSILGASEGGAADERRRAGAEIWKRVFG